MGQPYVGEIRMFAGNFPPAGWAFCDGALLPISENDTLFTLIGTTYGGDGQSNFALPDLRGRFPMHQGPARNGTRWSMAEKGGTESETLTTPQIPTHTHEPLASSSVGTSSNPANKVTAAWQDTPFSAAAPTAALHSSTLAVAGGSQPHENLPPYLAVNMIMSLYGVFPSPS